MERLCKRHGMQDISAYKMVGKYLRCIKCVTERHTAEITKQTSKTWRKNNPWGNAECHLNYNINTKITVFSHYGNGEILCVQCGVEDLNYLALDHIKDDGAEFRRLHSVGKNKMSGGKFYS